MLVRVIYRREKQVRGRDRGERGNLLSLVYQRSSKERRINPWDPPLSQSSQMCEETREKVLFFTISHFCPCLLYLCTTWQQDKLSHNPQVTKSSLQSIITNYKDPKQNIWRTRSKKKALIELKM
jgi:hypothetical protein